MADPAQSPEVGGGEGAKPSLPENIQDVKPEAVTAQVQNDVKNEAPAKELEKKAEISQPEALKQGETLEKKVELPQPEVLKQEETLEKKVELSQPEALKQVETLEKQVDLPPQPEALKQVETPVVAPELGNVEAPKLEAVKQDETPQPIPLKNVEPKQEDGQVPKAENSNGQNPQDNTTPKQLDWQQRELELLKKIDDLERVKNEKNGDGLNLEIKVREEEIDLLKARVKNLETELQAAMSKPGGKNHEMIENIKLQHEELLSKARGMIFDKTKMVKNQELQIEALTTQVQSLKDINVITKDLLEIRNSEVKAMEERLQAMEARFQAEKDRYGLVLQRAQTSSNINDDLRKEYETQLAIFKELREKYEQRVQALVAENARLKEEALKAGPSVVPDEHGV